MNKQCKQKNGKLPAKLAVTNCWELFYVDLSGPYTLKGKGSAQIDCMCVTMINPATSWFEIVELPVSKLSLLDISKGTKGHTDNNARKHERLPNFDMLHAFELI